MLTAIAEQFAQRIEFEPPKTGVAARWFPLGPDDRTIVIDPRVSFGSPTIRGVRTETLTELHLAGERDTDIIELYAGFGITAADIRAAVDFENSMWEAA